MCGGWVLILLVLWWDEMKWMNWRSVVVRCFGRDRYRIRLCVLVYFLGGIGLI